MINNTKFQKSIKKNQNIYLVKIVRIMIPNNKIRVKIMKIILNIPIHQTPPQGL